jgi:putative ABC transport system permease protein
MSDILGALVRRMRHVFRRRRFDADLAEEMMFHRAMRERELAASGADPRDAASAAKRAFGSSALAQDRARDVWLWPWLQDLARDLKFAFRLLAKEPGFTALAVAVLGLGIGVTNFQAVLVNAICVRGLPIPRVDRVVYIAARDVRDHEQALSYRELEEVRASIGASVDLAAFGSSRVIVGDEGRAPDRALAVYLSAGAFSILDATPALGRAFEPVDDRPGAPAVALLAHAFWMSRYGGDPAVVGRRVLIDGTPTAIVGVMADGFRFPVATDLWQPLALMPGIATAKRTVRSLAAIGRLAESATLADVRGRLDGATTRLSHDYPATNTGMRLTAVPINDKYNGRLTDPVWIAFMSVGVIVLLIACANAANLLLMRSAVRGHEMAVRASLGASRARLVRQLLMESAALAAVAGIVGIALSVACVRAITSIIPPNTLGYWITFTMDRRVLALLCVVCLGTVFVFGLAPALHVSKTDVVSLVKEGARGGAASARARRWTTAFLTAEFGLTMVMVAALVLNWRATRAGARADLVIDPDRIVTAGVTLSSARYGSPAQRQAFYDAVTERLGAVHDIAAFAVATALPGGGGVPRQTFVEGRERSATDPPLTSWTVTVGGDYFGVLGLGLVRGRAFDDRDGLAGAETAVVNQRFAQMFFPDADAIGHRVKLPDPGAAQAAPWLTIIGISPTVRQRPLPEPDPVVYLPMRSAPAPAAMLMIRAASGTTRVGPLLRSAVAAIDANTPLDRLMSMDQALALAQWNGRLSSDILNGIALVALCLAAIGVYAVASHGVAQRTQEIGIRMALGAPASHVVGMVLRRAAMQRGLGLLAGVVCILAWERMIGGGGTGGDLPARTMSDPINLVTVAALVTVIVAVASIVPALRATRLDPVAALRHE